MYMRAAKSKDRLIDHIAINFHLPVLKSDNKVLPANHIVPGTNDRSEKDATGGDDFNSRGLHMVTGILKRGPRHGASESTPTTSE